MKSFSYKNTLLKIASAPMPSNACRADLGHMTSPRGAALVTAMLITLVLSGLGLIALHSVNDTTWKTANYRSRQQASQVSDAVANLGVYRLGNAGHAYISNMESLHKRQTEDAVALGVTEGGDNDDPVDTNAIKLAMKRRGPMLVFAQKPNAARSERSISYLFTGKEDDDADEQTGSIFDDALSEADHPSSFAAGTSASNLDVDYRFVIRDSLDGPPATGFDRSHCFKKVTIASHSHISPNFAHQNGDRSWKARTNNATNRNIIETMVGPVPCGD